QVAPPQSSRRTIQATTWGCRGAEGVGALAGAAVSGDAGAREREPGAGGPPRDAEIFRRHAQLAVLEAEVALATATPGGLGAVLGALGGRLVPAADAVPADVGFGAGGPADGELHLLVRREDDGGACIHHLGAVIAAPELDGD